MKSHKKHWTFTRRQRSKDKKRRQIPCFGNPSKAFREEVTAELEPRSVDFFDENYLHPTRTHRGTGKWYWW